MPFNDQSQKLTFRNHVQTNTTILPFLNGNAAINTIFAQPSLNSGDAQIIADWYNKPTDPAKYAWHFTRSRMDLRRAVLNTTGSANQLDSLTGSKREALLWVIDDTLDCRLAPVRASIDDLTGTQNTLKAAILDSMKRLLTNIQDVFTTGVKSFANPGDNITNGGFEGSINGNDVSDVHGLPS